MNNISCDVCMDLIPLVQDGVASDDSVQAVKAHIAACPQCRALYENHPPAEPLNRAGNARIKKKLHIFFACLTFLGMFFAVSLLVREGCLYMLLLLPVLGLCGYGLFRWKALWKMPLLLWGIFLIAHLLTVLGGEDLNLPGVGVSLLVIGLAADVGTLIAGLLHFAFRKESPS